LILNCRFLFFFFNATATTEIYTLSLHDALPIFIRADPLMRSVLRSVMQETCAVAHAERAGLPDDFIDERMALVDTLPETMKASMLHDLEAGRRLELPWLSGAVVRLGERHGIATPANRTIVAALTPHVGGTVTGESAEQASATRH